MKHFSSHVNDVFINKLTCYNFIVFSVELGHYHLSDTSRINLKICSKGMPISQK